ncbi:MAG: hypothetical protein JNK09_01540 [Prolixibacteraceae bacterium]|nr:hypothetical protein [Prolixibacteraceae bacterium]
MAEMGLGYGSEYQLLRYLGHHRNELNKIINANTRLCGELVWLDFPKDKNRDDSKISLSLDGEHKGVDFLMNRVSKQNFDSLQNNWKNYWSSGGNQPNWDGIILHKNSNQEEWIIVEAKAHLKEIKSKTDSASNQNIQSAFNETQKRFDISNNNWFGEYYQLANRLAFINFLLDNNINASLLYVFFINGYEKRQIKDKKKITVECKSVINQQDWENAIKSEYFELGINDNAKQYISNIFIDCI